jgi:hypothetical protein
VPSFETRLPSLKSHANRPPPPCLGLAAEPPGPTRRTGRATSRTAAG